MLNAPVLCLGQTVRTVHRSNGSFVRDVVKLLETLEDDYRLIRDTKVVAKHKHITIRISQSTSKYHTVLYNVQWLEDLPVY